MVARYTNVLNATEIHICKMFKGKFYGCLLPHSFFYFITALLDDLDKELNNYIMRCREWYGWHFPELGKIISDNLTYCKCLQKVGEYFVYPLRYLSLNMSPNVKFFP